MKGYKAFNSNLMCRGFQFVEGEPHIYDGEVKLCKSGFHFCTELQDVVKYYHKPTMRVFEIEASGAITDAEDDCSKRACSEICLVKELSLEEVRDSITKSEQAYEWARDIGDREHMIQLITKSHHAYEWARDIGDREHMIQLITKSHHAYLWALGIGDKEHMKQFITDTVDAYLWATYIGDMEHMKQFISESIFARLWIEHVNPNDKQYFIDKGVLP